MHSNVYLYSFHCTFRSTELIATPWKQNIDKGIHTLGKYCTFHYLKSMIGVFSHQKVISSNIFNKHKQTSLAQRVNIAGRIFTVNTVKRNTGKLHSIENAEFDHY